MEPELVGEFQTHLCEQTADNICGLNTLDWSQAETIANTDRYIYLYITNVYSTFIISVTELCAMRGVFVWAAHTIQMI